jgi:hypothetical protein
MNVKFSHLLSGICLLLSVAYSASAQDDVPVPGPSTQNIFTQDPAVYDDKPLVMEQDQRFRYSADSLQHRTSITPSSKTKGNDPKKAQAEGDPLNFNFLHYIIHKFKASELMME